jgi:hypothetical protein
VLLSRQGVKFEPNSFKLNHEMVVVMGGRDSPGYRMFCELTVKAFLACRPYAEEVISTVELMARTDLPSFRGDGTIRRLRDRFKLNLSERRAAEYMMGVINNAFENARSTMYDRKCSIERERYLCLVFLRLTPTRCRVSKYPKRVCCPFFFLFSFCGDGDKTDLLAKKAFLIE